MRENPLFKRTSLCLFLLVPFLSYAWDEEDLKDLHKQLAAKQPVSCIHYNLEEADLSGLDLRKAVFSHALLKGASFKKAKLSKAKFHHADLRYVSFDHAVLNGAKFKGARLLGSSYNKSLSAKGTLLADDRSLSYKLAREKRIKLIEKKFLKGKLNSYVVERPLRPEEIPSLYHSFLIKKENAFKNDVSHYVIFDFRKHSLEDKERDDSVEKLRKDLIKSLFQSSSSNIVPLANHQAFLVFLSKEADTYDSSNNNLGHDSRGTLDLHGKGSLEVKFKKVEALIKEAYQKQVPYIDIITGRGLHNPEGKMGVLWRICKNCLKNRMFQPFIRGLQSINHDGGWRVFLNAKAQGQQTLALKPTKKSFLPFRKRKYAFQEIKRRVNASYTSKPLLSIPKKRTYIEKIELFQKLCQTKILRYPITYEGKLALGQKVFSAHHFRKKEVSKLVAKKAYEDRGYGEVSLQKAVLCLEEKIGRHVDILITENKKSSCTLEVSYRDHRAIAQGKTYHEARRKAVRQLYRQYYASEDQ